MTPPGNTIKHTLKEWELAPKKRLGQNFLIHKSTANRIVELCGITAHDTIVEIGVGFGALTQPLAERAKNVIGIEIDSGIIRWQQEKGNLPENTTIIHQDVLKTDFKQLADQTGSKLKIIANLPYSISNPLLFKLIENHDVMEWAVIMLQKEVGQRLLSEKGRKEYGILSVLMKTCGSVTPLLDVGPGHFHPKPKIHSLVVKITFQPIPDFVKKLPQHDKKLLRKIVNAAFQQRRKTLLNALFAGNLFDLNKSEIELLIKKAGIPPNIRGEMLSVEEFISLALVFEELN